MIINDDITTMKVVNDNEILISNELANKIKRKKYSLQFLPHSFIAFKNRKYIIHNGKKLKTDYIIDIVSNLILKYYFKKENRYALNATVLKDKYGYLYNYYIDYLVSVNVLYLELNHRKGFRSRIYSLNSSIFKSKMGRYQNKDKVLLKKYKKKVFGTIELIDDKSNHIDVDIKQKLISDLFNVDIETDRAIFFLDSLEKKDLDIYNRNLYSVDSINSKHIFYHFDNFGRMHTNFTILRSFIRKNCLLIDGEETCEIDISNSQPLFLTKLIHDSQTNWVKEDEFLIFKELTKNGTYYQYLMNTLNIKDRKEVKTLTYKVLFGKNAGRSKADKLFKSVFPTIHKFIVLYKKEHNDYKILSHHLQKMESNLIFNKIIRKVISNYPEVRIITVHDSIVIPRRYKESVNAIFQTELLSEFDF